MIGNQNKGFSIQGKDANTVKTKDNLNPGPGAYFIQKEYFIYVLIKELCQKIKDFLFLKQVVEKNLRNLKILLFIIQVKKIILKN